MFGLKKEEIVDLKKKKNKFYTNNLAIFFQSAMDFKITVVLSKKFGKANKRNLVRRRIREAFRTNISQIQLLIYPKLNGNFTWSNIISEIHFFLKHNKSNI